MRGTMTVISVETAVNMAVKKDYQSAAQVFEEYFQEYYKEQSARFDKSQVATKIQNLYEDKLKGGLFSRSQKEMATEAVFAVFRATKNDLGISDEAGRAKIRLSGFDDI